MTIKTLRSTRSFQDGKNQQSKLILKLRLFHHNAEQRGDCGRQECIRSTSKCTKYKRIFTMLHSHTEDGSNLIEHNFLAIRRETAIISLVRKFINTCIVGSAIKAKCCNGDNITLVKLSYMNKKMNDLIPLAPSLKQEEIFYRTKKAVNAFSRPKPVRFPPKTRYLTGTKSPVHSILSCLFFGKPVGFQKGVCNIEKNEI